MNSHWAIGILALAASCGTPRAPADTRDSSAPQPAPARANTTTDSVVTIRVNTGPHGMAARVRWTLPGDGHAIIAMEDPVGVEAEPVVNGFVFASEPQGTILQVDGVWDVAPSPDWSKLAIGRGFVLRGGETDSISEAEWTRLEGWLPQDVAAPSVAELRRRLRPHLFPASGMAYAWGLGLAQIIDLSRFGAGRAPVVEGPTLALDGWRVRWNRSGDSVAAGSVPLRVEDHAVATRWTIIPAASRDSRGPRRALADTSSLAPVNWIEGPTLDISTPVDVRAATVLQLATARIESRDGVITRVTSDGMRVRLGPGVPLAATASGVYVLALVPRAGPTTEPNVELVLYAHSPD